MRLYYADAITLDAEAVARVIDTRLPGVQRIGQADYAYPPSAAAK